MMNCVIDLDHFILNCGHYIKNNSVFFSPWRLTQVGFLQEIFKQIYFDNKGLSVKNVSIQPTCNFGFHLLPASRSPKLCRGLDYLLKVRYIILVDAITDCFSGQVGKTALCLNKISKKLIHIFVTPKRSICADYRPNKIKQHEKEAKFSNYDNGQFSIAR